MIGIVGVALVGLGAAPFLTADTAESPARRNVSEPRKAVDYATDVAPILYANCTGCHSPGGPAPFSLRSYDDARERADKIARVTAARAMPPWLPRAEPGTFVGERRLSDQHIEVLREWAESGAPAGNLDRAPPAPPVAGGWRLGEPDLVVRVPTYTLRAEGHEVYRNLVIDVPIESRRYVRSAELRPGDPRVIHHARMMVDTTDSSRALDLEDEEPGFDGMELRSNASDPDGHFLGWTAGKGTLPPLEGMAWTLDPGDQLVLQLHMRTTGRVEKVESEIGFYFSDDPPTRRPVLLVLSSLMIDIPAGDPAHGVTSSYELPVGVDVLSVYPHAHYLGKTLRGYATLPNGSVEDLIDIPEWDFDWQEDYRFMEPVSLPAGTRLTLDFQFDNSASNPHNPNDPPRRVVYGSSSSDEMADLIFQVLPHDPSQRSTLVADVAWHYEVDDMNYMAAQNLALGHESLSAGDAEQAVFHFREAMQYRADHPPALTGLARSFLMMEDFATAAVVAERAVQVTRAAEAEPLMVLSRAYAREGDTERAVRTAEAALAVVRRPEQAALGDSIRALLESFRAPGP